MALPRSIIDQYHKVAADKKAYDGAKQFRLSSYALAQKKRNLQSSSVRLVQLLEEESSRHPQINELISQVDDELFENLGKLVSLSESISQSPRAALRENKPLTASSSFVSSKSALDLHALPDSEPEFKKSKSSTPLVGVDVVKPVRERDVRFTPTSFGLVGSHSSTLLGWLAYNRSASQTSLSSPSTSSPITVSPKDDEPVQGVEVVVATQKQFGLK